MSISTLTAEALLESLVQVIDPGIGVNIVDLGLVYGIDLRGDAATIQMTLRSSEDPFRSTVEFTIQQTLKRLHPELNQVMVELVWDPEWHESFISGEGLRQIESPIQPHIVTPDSPLTIKDVLDSLRYVLDPEVGINIVDLGLIYRLELPPGVIDLDMTMTTPSCPLQATIESAVNRTLRIRHPEINRFDVNVVWDPPWNVNRISPAGRIELGWGPDRRRLPGERS